LIDLSRDMSQKRVDHERLDGSIITMLEIIEKELGAGDEIFIPVGTLRDKANQTDTLSFKNSNSLGRYMSKLDIYSKQKKTETEDGNEGSKVINVRGYSITRAWLEDKKKRYIS